MKYTALLLLLIATSLDVQAATDCIKIENARERLECFDRMYPRDGAPVLETEAVTAEDSVLSPTPKADAPPTSAPAAAPAAAAGAAAVVPQTAPESAPAEPEKAGLFDLDEAVDLTSTIKAVRKRESQKMVFQLENDQIWLQSSPRSLPIYVGDVVTIKNGFIGGYIMRNEKGTSTRVQRIQ
jgi:hypothetical protein